MKMTYDKEANAAYIFFQKIDGNNKVTKTISLSDDIILDIGKRGEIFGLEILNATKSIGQKLLKNLKKETMNIPIVAIS